MKAFGLLAVCMALLMGHGCASPELLARIAKKRDQQFAAIDAQASQLRGRMTPKLFATCKKAIESRAIGLLPDSVHWAVISRPFETRMPACVARFATPLIPSGIPVPGIAFAHKVRRSDKPNGPSGVRVCRFGLKDGDLVFQGLGMPHLGGGGFGECHQLVDPVVLRRSTRMIMVRY